MRLSLYNHIKNMLDTLGEAVNYIVQNKNIEMSTYLLTNCNDVIENVKNVLIENSASITDAGIFEHLNICENQVVELENLIQSNKDYGYQITLLENEIRELQILFQKSVNFKYHIVFFAELGQKWDSMNSVYRAFKRRADCEVKVVLTPIFREVKNGEKVERKVIYEDYLTSMGIPYISYKEYDLVEELPDMAFISNPYESVTLPQFWPENIAKYTKLIYIPYYTGIVTDIAFYQSNFQLPVARHAWRIIAQSERIKELHEKYAPYKGKNVVVTGLPKWDELFDMNNKKVSIKDDWKEKLIGRKTILWNSHFNVNGPTSTLLEYGQKLIDLFTNRNDIALIWRPHPMTETVIKLYLPDKLDYWNELISIVKNSTNMVLDVDLSYQTSFQVSDALISDYSSMIAQYVIVRKPILWLNKPSAKQYFNEVEMLVQLDDIERANTFDQIEDFIDKLKNGNVLNEKLNVENFMGGIPKLNGRIGENVSTLLIEQFNRES